VLDQVAPYLEQAAYLGEGSNWVRDLLTQRIPFGPGQLAPEPAVSVDRWPGRVAAAERIMGGAASVKNEEDEDDKEVVGASAVPGRATKADPRLKYSCQWCGWRGHLAEDCETPHWRCDRNACVLPPSHKHFQHLEGCPNSQYWSGHKKGGARVPPPVKGEGSAAASNPPTAPLPEVPPSFPIPVLPVPPRAAAYPVEGSSSPLTPLELTPEPMTIDPKDTVVIALDAQAIATVMGRAESPVTPTVSRQSRIPRGKGKGRADASPRKQTSPPKGYAVMTPLTVKKGRKSQMWMGTNMTEEEARSLCDGASGL
jgi:hypothetical protein